MDHLEYIEYLKKAVFTKFSSMTTFEKAEERSNHSIGVMNIAGKMAFIYNNDEEFIKKCEIAGILHDYAKFYSIDDFKALTKKHNVDFNLDLESYRVFHGYYGYLALIDDLNITDSDILMAVKNHIMSRSEMTLIEEIIYVADLIEEGRTEEEIPILRPLRKLALGGKLKEAVAFESKHVISHLINKNIVVNSLSLDCYNGYIKYLKKEGL